MDELVLPSGFARNAPILDQARAVEGAEWLIGHMSEHIGVPDLGAVGVLDVGCGVRFTQAFLNRGLPIKHYVGVDVSRKVIDFLRANVSDPRFEFFHLDAQNDLYNATGQPLAEMTIPEIDDRRFDLICLFSVFTHLAPPDYVAMLQLLRRFIQPDGRLFYTLFVRERSEGGHGYVDRMARAMETSDDPRVKEAITSSMQNRREPPDFEDIDRSAPLRVAMYSRRHALELIDGTGWEVLSVSPPDVHLQHHIVCSPI